MSVVGEMLSGLLKSGDWSITVSGGVLIVLSLAFMTHFCPGTLNERIETRFVKLSAPIQGVVLAIALALFGLFQAAGNPFIYFQF